MNGGKRDDEIMHRTKYFVASVTVHRLSKASQMHRDTKPTSKTDAQREVETSSRETYSSRWSLSTGSTASLRLIAKWLEKCLESHKKNCSLKIRKYSLKIRKGSLTRFLDLDAALGEGDIRLIPTKGLDGHPYATLSYRWGARKNVKLTRETYDKFRTRIRVATHPKTIRDAI